MVDGNGKRAKIAAVDADYRPRVDNEQDRLRAHEDRQLRTLIRGERSGAYWFAATKWGMLGLVTGMILGGLGMYYASIATIDMAQEAITKGAIVERLSQERDAKADDQPLPAPAP